MQIYIDGIPDNATDSSLERLFAGVRSFEYVKVIRDIATGASRRFAIAFVTDDAEARAVIARLNGAVLGEGHLTVFKIHDTLAGEMEFREWMRDNAIDVLRKGGLSAGQNVVDYGCGPGIFSLAAAGIVGENGRVYALDVRQRALGRPEGESYLGGAIESVPGPAGQNEGGCEPSGGDCRYAVVI
jgi:hypothetical protein